MALLSRFRSRNLLSFVVPALIAFLSAYWFRKKKKLKCSEPSEEKEDCITQNITDQSTVLSNNIPHTKLQEFQLDLEGSKALASDETEEPSNVVMHVIDVEKTFESESCCVELESVENAEKDYASSNLDEDEKCSCSSDAIDVENPCISAAEKNVDIASCNVEAYVQSLQDSKIVQDSENISLQSNHISANASESELVCHIESYTETNKEFAEMDVNPPEQDFPIAEKCSEVLPPTAESPSNNSVPKSSPASTGSPVSHSNDTGSDCEALDSVGTSSISLNELFSLSPVGSIKESMNFQVDAFVTEDASNDSGKGSTMNLDPASSSLSSEVEELPSDAPRKSSFRFSRRSNADVLCREGLNSSEQKEELSENYGCYSDSNCNPSHLITKRDLLGEVPGINSNGCDMNYVPVIDTKNFEMSTADHYVYEFEIPQELCGRLIGRQGKNVKFIKELSRAVVYIKRHPYNPRLKIAVVEGSRSDVHNALELLRKKFPPSQFPGVTLAQTNLTSSALGVPVPESLQLQLPEHTSVDVILSSMVNAGHFFLQQPTHPTYPSLSTLDQCMMACYSQGDTPQLPQPVEAGVVCAASVMGGWYRAQVMCVCENNEDCEVKFVDYGGYSQIPISSLRQIRSDFMTLPFQASECYLAKVSPLSEFGWSAEASATFEELAQGQILQAVINTYDEDGTPNVYLYRVQGVTSTFINRELVSRGLGKWIEHQ